VRRAPAHAGRLRPWERLVFALVFTLMAGFVVTITVSAAGLRQQQLLAGPTTAAGSKTEHVDSGEIQQADKSPAGRGVPTKPPSARLDALLAAALSRVLRTHPGQVAVGVIDQTSGQRVLYHAGQHFRAAGIVQPDILAALLVRHQQAGTRMTAAQADLAAAMIDGGSDAAATSLWRAIGGGNGLASVNHRLRLRHTIPGEADLWWRTRTTVADQLQLLTDLTSGRSPLTGPGRDFELGLMAGGAIEQYWGVPAAAAAGARYVVDDGWLPGSKRWVVNSIGVVTRAGQVLLIAVLSSRNATKAAGISLVSAAAVAAADVVTRAVQAGSAVRTGS
jgi:hypothetical protein